jgi:hypothetical protein
VPQTAAGEGCGVRIVVADHEGGVVTEIVAASLRLDGVEVEEAEVLVARLGEPPAAGGGYDPFVRLQEIGNTYCERRQRFVVSFVNGEPEPDAPDPEEVGEAPIDTPAAALRRTLQFLGSCDGYQNHWHVFDRQTGRLHQLEQDQGGVTLSAEDAPTTIELAGDAELVEHLADEHPSLFAALPHELSAAAVLAAQARHDEVHEGQVFAHDHPQPGERAGG